MTEETLSLEKRFSSLITIASHQRMASCMVSQKEFLVLGDDDVVLQEVSDGHSMAKDMIDCWSNLDYQDKNGRTALMVALEYNSSNEHYLNTPSDISQYQGRKGIAKYLIDKGANLDIKDKSGNTALMYSLGLESDHQSEGYNPQDLSEGRQEITKYLIKKGAGIEEKDSNGRTVLMNQIRMGNKEMVKCLIDHGANLDEKDMDGLSVFVYALDMEEPEIAQYMIEKSVNWDKKELLTIAIQNCNQNVAKYLIDKGANLDVKGHYGHTALMLAIILGNIETAKYLIDKGANLDIKNKRGNTALMVALKCYRCCNENIDNIDGDDEFPSISSAEKLKSERLKEIAKYLVDKGANLDVKGYYGHTALMLAIILRNIETAKYLIDKGANLDIKDERGNTALVIALKGSESFDDTDINFNAFGSDAGDDRIDDDNDDGIDEEFYEGSMSEELKEIAKYLIDKGANLDMMDKRGITALILAITAGRTEIAKYLIDNGANLEEKDLHGANPLMYSCQNFEIAKYLIDKGVKLDEKESNGHTPLMIAILSEESELAKYLIDKGASLEEKNNDGHTPLMLATEKNVKEVIQYITEKSVSK